MKDLMTNWRSSGSLTATETSAGIAVGPAPVVGIDVVAHVPAQNAAGDTLDITFEESSTLSGTYREFAKLRPQVTGSGTASATNGKSLRNKIHPTLKYVRCVLTVAGSTPNFGAVVVGVDEGANQNDLQVGSNNP